MEHKKVTEKDIENLLKDLSKKQLIQFAVSCIERVVYIYEMIEKRKVEYPDNKGYNSICSILSFIKEDIAFFNEDEIVMHIYICNEIIGNLEDLDDDWFPVICIIQSIIDVLNFCIHEDVYNIFSCVENNLEIINQLKSDEYVNTINSEATDDEMQNYLQNYFDKELFIDFKSLKLIKENCSQSELDLFVDRNKLDIHIY